MTEKAEQLLCLIYLWSVQSGRGWIYLYELETIIGAQEVHEREAWRAAMNHLYYSGYVEQSWYGELAVMAASDRGVQHVEDLGEQYMKEAFGA